MRDAKRTLSTACVTLVSLFCFTVLADRAKRHGISAANLAYVLPAVVVLLRPRASVAYGALLVACVGHIVAFFATSSTQIIWYVSALFFLSILIATLARAISSRSPSSRTPTFSLLYEDIAPAARALAVIGMGAAGFAKLNADFLNQDVSCGAIYTAWLLESPLLFFVPKEPHIVNALEFAGMWGAVVIEIAAPLLLCFAKTRGVGLSLFSLLCGALALNPRSHYFDFAGLYFALALFFVPPRGISRAVARARCVICAIEGALRLPIKGRTLRTTMTAMLAVIAATIAFGPSLGLRRSILLEVMRWGLLGAWLAFLGSFARDAWTARLQLTSPAAPTPMGWPARLACIAPLIMLLNEASPYLGLIHRPTMTMAANLEMHPGSSNHLLVEAPMVWSASRVVVVRDGAHALLKRGQRMAYARFVEFMTRDPEGTVTFSVDGGPLESARGDDPRFAGGSFLARLFRLGTFGPPRTQPKGCGKARPRASRPQTTEGQRP